MAPPKGNQNARKWKSSEEDFVRANYLTMTQEEIGKTLGKKKKAIQFKVSQLGLKKPHSLWVKQGYERNPGLRTIRSKTFSEVQKKRLKDPRYKEQLRVLGKKGSEWSKTNEGRSFWRNESRRRYLEGKWIPPIFEGHIVKQDTKLEVAVKEKLDALGLRYEHPFNLHNHFLCDFYIPSLNFILEADGCYWHGCAQCGFENNGKAGRTRRRNSYIKAHNYNLLVVPEHEVPDFPSLARLGLRKLPQ